MFAKGYNHKSRLRAQTQMVTGNREKGDPERQCE